jgi:HK97 family phage major capsid protein
MNIAVLERELEQKQTHARAVFEKHTKAAEVAQPARELTDDERKEINAALAAAKLVKAKLDRAKGDQATSEEIERLLSAQDRQRTDAASQNRDNASKQQRLTLGQQFVQSEAFAEWNKATRGRKGAKGAQWASPVITLHPHGETLTSDSGSPGSGGDLIVPQYLPGVKVPLLFRRLTIADLIAPGTTDSNAIIYMQETLFDNKADTVPEGTIKPESALRFDQVSDLVHTIAHWLPVTEQMLEDVSGLRSYIDARLRLGVQLAEEQKLLDGAASPAEITGIRNRVGLRTAEAAGGSPDDPNADAVFRQMMGIYTDSLVRPDGIVMNPTDWQGIQLMKDGNGAYMGGGPFSLPPAPSLWGLPVVVTPAIEPGTALVGAFQSAAQIFRKGGIDVQATNSHSDYFIRNLVAIRAEERLALAVYRPSAFGEVTGL